MVKKSFPGIRRTLGLTLKVSEYGKLAPSGQIFTILRHDLMVSGSVFYVKYAGKCAENARH
jgi:hypothetical protein